MNLTAEMLETRMALDARVHRLELDVTRDEQVRAAANLVRRKMHSLGNAVQIIQLSSLELERRVNTPDVAEVLADLRTGAEQATSALTDLLAATAFAPRTTKGAAAVPALRMALASARPAILARCELVADLAEAIATFATAEELEVLAISAILDAADAGATRVSFAVRARTIVRQPWIQLVCVDDRRDPESAATPSLVDALATRAGGEASRSPGRTGLELAIELPVAT